MRTPAGVPRRPVASYKQATSIPRTSCSFANESARCGKPHRRCLQFGHFETIKPGEILDFRKAKVFCFFAGLGISFGVVTSRNGVIIYSEPYVRSKGSGMDSPTY